MGLHDGHRQRSKRRYLALGAEGMEDHQLLELLLFYAIPRQDTNETAHRLIQRFGSLQGVLHAAPEELTSVEGVGENAAVLVRLVGDMALRARCSSLPQKVLNSPDRTGVGYPEDVGRFYRLGEYEGYSWTAHGRYPTNTPGWRGGAHPFSLLDWSIVHNGEISSYDANRRCIEMYGYKCNLQTDTEVITYIADYLLRRQGLTLEEMASVIAAPFWSTIRTREPAAARQLTYLRTIYPSLLITGPFSIILGFNGGLMALNDRLKLRSMVTAEKDDKVFIASEEAAIRVMAPDAENLYAPMGGEPFIVKVKEGAY